ncbi:type II secretion system minor pseudopilin GspI [Polynucleobacter sp. AP-Melu-500A-A1]|jgi:general secretion pathway protein I|uniref:type II secretion system minor pseudopilin GspI n=1 Tax=Polynucleobacter sp. AP-Melu-500A-A1 TaxID=2576929 RepID=UPI001C0DBCD1|nr:type II secretion system minor pseudopilin GspI [Polynucleobacter sp. AP-Melu-500A-A1]MBU3630712.1 type II secretion system minor pseudopilin GspI [Polynucleobacter sp. AP-Melu-500A-A1]
MRISSTQKNGFILVEVLVGLIVLSITLIAALRALALGADTQLAVAQRSMALWSADNALNEIRMKRIWPESGTSTFSCPQGTFVFVCERKVSDMPNPSFRRVEVTVYLASQANSVQVNGPRLAWLVTVVPNFSAGAL